MKEDVRIYKENELSLRVDSEIAIARELNEAFSFYVSNFKYHPKFKAGIWDGKIRLFNTNKRHLPVGLIIDLVKFCKKNEYSYWLDPNLKTINLSQEIQEFSSNFDVITKKSPTGKYQFQADLVKQVLSMNKALVLSPTGSGKSSAIYLIVRFLLRHTEGDILITVPSLGLISQLQSDFKSYVNDAFDVDHWVDASNGSTALNSKKRVLITNWHAVVKQPRSFFDRFSSYICDEAHLADSVSITSIVNKLLYSTFRFGFTGTLDGTKSNEMTLKGLFGPVVRTVTTKDLINEDVLSELKIVVKMLVYSKELCKRFKETCSSYNDEIDWLVSSEERNKLIISTALSQTHNTMVLFTRVDQHGLVLYNLALEEAKKYGKTVFIISGDTDPVKREEIRLFAQDNDNVVIFASYATTATGTNIPNLHTIIFAHPHKGRIRNLQSIGRGLRKHSSKEHAMLIDFGDDLSSGTRRLNFSLKHLIERLNLYKSEGFQYSIEKVDITE